MVMAVTQNLLGSYVEQYLSDTTYASLLLLRIWSGELTCIYHQMQLAAEIYHPTHTQQEFG
jgi:hypothetical protein